ncbi:hypothetical protein [Pseudorhodobacter sp.]|uniref:hypothetical protein n=1 Tax=Pseudorhodobacter sp. TaxID=1934400 RepID=UPI002648EE5F|nr:hypothetical protein [Pseudorhodobacter sp.]MDN5788204.1 hypothetical protein [Pseudorhodobacter sp.]
MTKSSMHTSGEDGRPGLRDWRAMMQPERLAAIQPSRFSGARAFMAKMIRERWDINIQRFDVNANAEGTAVYSIKSPTQEFSFIAFSYAPSREGRTGRIIGRAWDMKGTLNEGPATEADITHAREQLPLLYRGRATPNALIWCRSNRSMRVFDATLNALAEGHQPSIEDINSVCYLMRNTGLDGNGTFGTRPFPSLGASHVMGGMLEAQLLVAYLMREFSCDLVEHLARHKSDKAVPLDPALRRFIGVGNGSALGLIFFVQKHPRLIDSWLTARETAIAEALAMELGLGDPRFDILITLIRRAAVFREQDRMRYETFTSSTQIALDLRSLLPLLAELRDKGTLRGHVTRFELDALARDAEASLAPESYETLLSMMIELVPDRTDALLTGIGGADEFTVDPVMTAGELAAVIDTEYDWALTTDMTAASARDYVWYKSETAEEPRRGLREEAPDARDLGLDLPGDIQRLRADLAAAPADQPMALFLLSHPAHRQMVGRVQGLRRRYFHSPHANINATDFVPIDLVRLMNVALHGIDKTRDFLQRNLRGVLYHGAPTRDDIRAGHGAGWFYPEEPCQ